MSKYTIKSDEERQTAVAEWQEEQRKARAAKREELQDNPFDPRIEVSADAKHIARKIVMHLWILFVALPVVSAILYEIVK